MTEVTGQVDRIQTGTAC